MSRADELFEAFVADRAAGRRPRVSAVLAQVDAEERPALAERLEAHIDAVPAPRRSLADIQADPLAQRVVAAVEPVLAAGETWPVLLPAARDAAQVSRTTLVQRLADALGVGERADKVGDYYHRMETGSLPAGGVSPSVLEALAALVAVPVQRLRDAGARTVGPAAGGGVFARSAEPLTEIAAPAPAAPGPDAERDAVDRLFLDG